MKFLTTNFVRCAIKSCDGAVNSFPLKYSEIELVQEEQDFQPEFILGILPRLDWPAILKVAADLGNTSLPSQLPEIDINDPSNEILLKDLHTLLIETQLVQGKMICENCNHVYHIKDSIPNFLLPPHLAN
ncbi:Methylation of tRNA, rRNA protein an d transcirption factor [Komagataella phaffii CBS 7435]|uniref:Multifunctional methyltransferase subunit trm112 n=2 Tax=Komagataella phaffii TaxID=460519 RepID=C4QY96_KOMPG|nr:Subunit of an adoMet-dependent tRNA methyltransferase (MTase) complex (Trm11p-Trm112p) [Komagataella phaffii GS115]AOA60666.1 GQ67_01793T0 [Komagataella phaffii]CAH2447041.1 Methylation of tRNA, rRNA protein an d transcirption factor [Komagataella phaffii CBS 7435]AOA65968.1 GQ68_01808T0 [Komagataella phaffii GS115]CAY68219.1 Subunit of an adoMet-dependent tRNA methyltransferase (MTase) complex (Trm11p-Trm112p) [Komagataella phaffii GS115]CCA37291.1 Methylation of tRNA, rRNA protein an d tr